uniref:Uncharacterized protein n=1 Tax=Arundo donax TaxID=35708 RepID=A0A0A9A2N9_ARUDO
MITDASLQFATPAAPKSRQNYCLSLASLSSYIGMVTIAAILLYL